MVWDKNFPFSNGSMLSYEGSGFHTTQRKTLDEARFTGTLTYETYSRGRSSAMLWFTDTKGHRYGFFMSDADTILPLLVKGKLTATFIPTKHPHQAWAELRLEDRRMTNTALQKYQAEADEVAQALAKVHVTNKEEYALAADYLTDVKTTLKRIDEEREKISKPQYEAWKATNAFFGGVAEKYKRAEADLKAKMAAFIDAESEREKKLLAAVASGDMAAQSALAIVDKAAPSAPGITVRKETEWELVDLSQVPREYLKLDEKKVNAAAKVGLQIPGIRMFQKTNIAAGSKPM
jgi:hypothetical protein